MPAARRRPVGAHAAPRHGYSPKHVKRVLPGPLPAVLLGVIGGSLALVGVLPSAPSPQVVSAAAVTAPDVRVAAAAPDGVQPSVDDLERASRSRLRAAPDVAAQAAAPPSPVPPPPAPVLPGCDGEKRDLDRYANGRLPESVLCTVPGTGEALRADAAVDFVRLAQAYEAHFGREICLTDGYRTLSEQKAVKRAKPRLAARPGTSEHGWGVAVDLACGVQSFRSAQHAWMVQHAEDFGWYLPSWAKRGGSKPEPWHWEYSDK